jgi:hypothetical protein
VEEEIQVMELQTVEMEQIILEVEVVVFPIYPILH